MLLVALLSVLSTYVILEIIERGKSLKLKNRGETGGLIRNHRLIDGDNTDRRYRRGLRHETRDDDRGEDDRNVQADEERDGDFIGRMKEKSDSSSSSNSNSADAADQSSRRTTADKDYGDVGRDVDRETEYSNKELEKGGGKLEITELCEIFLGAQGRNAYSCSIAIYIYGTLTAYCAVFAESLSSHIPVFDSETSNYSFYLSIFFVTVVPMSCLELNEQIEWQVILALCRVLMVILLTGSVVLASVDTE